MTIDTPIGQVSWEGELTPDTVVTLPNGGETPISRWIALTNGDALEWLIAAGVLA